MLCLGLAKKAFFQKRLAKNAGEKRFTGKKKSFLFPRLSFFRKKGFATKLNTTKRLIN